MAHMIFQAGDGSITGNDPLMFFGFLYFTGDTTEHYAWWTKYVPTSMRFQSNSLLNAMVYVSDGLPARLDFDVSTCNEQGTVLKSMSGYFVTPISGGAYTGVGTVALFDIMHPLAKWMNVKVYRHKSVHTEDLSMVTTGLLSFEVV
jgi:hypothetical protein